MTNENTLTKGEALVECEFCMGFAHIKDDHLMKGVAFILSP
jgi:hypothetical protein